MTYWFFSDSVFLQARVPARIRHRALEIVALRDSDEQAFPAVIACASDVLGPHRWRPPDEARNPDTRYLILADIAEPAVLGLVSAFDVRRPEQRMHVTRDPRSIHRLLVAQFRDVPFEGIVDAYLLFEDLILLLGDFSIRTFPCRNIPSLNAMNWKERCTFEIDEDGSFLYWPHADLHLGVSQLLQAVNPAYLAEVEIRRFSASEAFGRTLIALREARGLRQCDVPGLSERQVRRIEQGVSRLTATSATKLAEAYGMSIGQLLDRLASARVVRHEPPVLEHDELDFVPHP